MSASRQIHLVRRPKGVPVPADFVVVTVQTPDVGDGEVQVQNLIMSVDPYMRPRLTADQPLDVAMIIGASGAVASFASASTIGLSRIAGSSPSWGRQASAWRLPGKPASPLLSRSNARSSGAKGCIGP